MQIGKRCEKEIEKVPRIDINISEILIFWCIPTNQPKRHRFVCTLIANKVAATFSLFY